MKALLVDDSRAQRAFLKRLLTALGFETVEAEHGGAALEQLRAAGPFDLALVDWNMPVMNGIDFVRRARDGTCAAPHRVVMVTSEAAPERLQEALEAGADEYIMKPFCEQVLADKLRLVGLLPE